MKKYLKLYSKGSECLSKSNPNHIQGFLTLWTICIEQKPKKITVVQYKNILKVSGQEKNIINGNITENHIKSILMKEIEEKERFFKAVFS